MAKPSKTLIIIGLTLLVFFLIMSWIAPKQLDWSPTYNTKDKIPMGLYVFDQEIDSLWGKRVTRIKDPLKEYFYDGYFEDENEPDSLNPNNNSTDTLEEEIPTDSLTGLKMEDQRDEWMIYSNLLYINKDIYWTEEDVRNVCRFVEEGNSAFISCLDLPPLLQDELSISLVSMDFVPLLRKTYDTLSLTLNDSNNPYLIDNNGITGSYFTDYDTATSQKLGYVNTTELKTPNFLKINYGKGIFFIHLEPAVFTNFHLLKDQHHVYVEKILSNIPSEYEIVWTLHNQTSAVISDSPLRFILSQRSLRWAWYLLLAGIMTFIIFNLRRSQRVIPIIPKPTNTSVDFVKTIGNLYFLEGDIKNMIDKKIVYLLEKIRSDYLLNTDTLDDKFVHLLQLKSGKEEKIVKQMIFLVNKHKESDYTRTIDDLKRLNNAIENFYN